jgi:hypothetical protein
MMRTPAKDFALLYFENQAHRARASGWTPNTAYGFTWFNTQSGEWQASTNLQADAQGAIQLPPFPGGRDVADTDWAAKITTRKGTN